MSETTPNKEKKKRISAGIMIAIIVAALAALYYIFPKMESFRLSSEKDSQNLPMIVSTEGVLYRRYPLPEWQGVKTESRYPMGIGDIYYLYQYENDPTQIFLHGVEYVWYETTVEYYRDDFVFPIAQSENIDHMQGMLYINAAYSEVTEETTSRGSVYTEPITERALIDQVFALIDSPTSRILLDESEPFYELGSLSCICKPYPGMQYVLPVISYNEAHCFIVYETDEVSWERIAYRVEIPDHLYSSLFGDTIAESVQPDFLEDLLT